MNDGVRGMAAGPFFEGPHPLRGILEATPQRDDLLFERRSQLAQLGKLPGTLGFWAFRVFVDGDHLLGNGCCASRWWSTCGRS